MSSQRLADFLSLGDTADRPVSLDLPPTCVGFRWETDSGAWVWDGSSWIQIAGLSGVSTTLDSLTDVDINTGLAPGDVLTFDGANWGNDTAASTSPGGSSGDIQTNNGAGGFGSIAPASGIATFLEDPSSANLRSSLTDETGTGAAVFANSPTLVTPNLGVPSAIDLSNATNFPSGVGFTTVTKTADYTVLSGDSGKHFNNIGAGGDIVLSLPAAAANLNYGFAVFSNHYIRLLADGTDVLSWGSDSSAGGGYIRSTTQYSSIQIEAHGTGRWIVSASAGTWSIDA